MTNFPQPAKLGPATTRWREADLLQFEGEAEIPPGARSRFLRDTEVAARYGVARQTIWRWASESAQRERGAA